MITTLDFSDLSIWFIIYLMIRVLIYNMWPMWVIVVAVFLYLSIKSYKERNAKDVIILMTVVIIFSFLTVRSVNWLYGWNIF